MHLLAQGPRGALRGPTTATGGSTIAVTVGTNDTVVEVIPTALPPPAGAVEYVPVGPDRVATVRVPNVPGGFLLLRVRNGSRGCLLILEILAPIA